MMKAANKIFLAITVISVAAKLLLQLYVAKENVGLDSVLKLAFVCNGNNKGT